MKKIILIDPLRVAEKVIDGSLLGRNDAMRLLDCALPALLCGANRIREHFKGKKVNLCGIVNAKSGACTENCAFCAQSAKHRTNIEKYPLISGEGLERALKTAKGNKAGCFGIVTSGNRLSGEELNRICSFIHVNRNKGIRMSASLGELDLGELRKLKKSGLKRYHHNIETSEAFFPNICKTHSYADRIRTARAAKQAGLELCCGGIFGLGEKRSDRVSFALALRELEADSVPLNFLNPVAGTPLENAKPLSCGEILRSIALMRYMLPEKDIAVCGGREVNLRDLQSWIFFAGANGMMTGNYLTTAGRSAEKDLKMIEDLGLEANNGK